MSDVWFRCSACKKDIKFGAVHQVCSVSTCNRRATRLVFCSVPCWDSHVATLRHRDAWAVEARAPSREQWEREQADAGEADTSPGSGVAARMVTPSPPRPAPMPERRVVTPPPRPADGSGATPGGAVGSSVGSTAGGAAPTFAETEREILVVVSKLKKYIKDRSGFNTSDAVAEALSDHVRAVCDQAIRIAATDGRKTVLDRDVPRPPRS